MNDIRLFQVNPHELLISIPDSVLRRFPESYLDKLGKMVADNLKNRRRGLFRCETWEECVVNGHTLMYFGPDNYSNPEKTGAFCQSCTRFHGDPPER